MRIVTLLSLLFLCSCQIQDGSNPQTLGDTPQDPSAPPNSAAHFSEGWTEITMISGGAKVDFDAVGHFVTSRNACFKEESGALALGDWNIISRTMNQAVTKPPLTEEFCFTPPSMEWGFDGIAEIRLASGGKRTIYEARGSRVCTTIADTQAAQEALIAINHSLLAAARENCTVNR